MHHGIIVLIIYIKEGVRCRLNSRKMLEWTGIEMRLRLNPTFFFSLSLQHKFNWTVSAVLKKSGALAEKESVWEAYWLAAPGRQNPTHHTSRQHIPKGVHLNVIWQPSAISKLNLDIDFDIQRDRWKTLFCFHTRSQTQGCLSWWVGLLPRPYTVCAAII